MKNHVAGIDRGTRARPECCASSSARYIDAATRMSGCFRRSSAERCVALQQNARDVGGEPAQPMLFATSTSPFVITAGISSLNLLKILITRRRQR